MKIKENFVLRNVAQTWVVLPLADQTLDISAMMTLNESGVLLWNTLEKGADMDDLVNALTAEYEVSAEQARTDVEEFVVRLNEGGYLEL